MSVWYGVMHVEEHIGDIANGNLLTGQMAENGVLRVRHVDSSIYPNWRRRISMGDNVIATWGCKSGHHQFCGHWSTGTCRDVSLSEGVLDESVEQADW